MNAVYHKRHRPPRIRKRLPDKTSFSLPSSLAASCCSSATKIHELWLMSRGTSTCPRPTQCWRCTMRRYLPKPWGWGASWWDTWWARADGTGAYPTFWVSRGRTGLTAPWRWAARSRRSRGGRNGSRRRSPGDNAMPPRFVGQPVNDMLSPCPRLTESARSNQSIRGPAGCRWGNSNLWPQITPLDGG